MIKTYRAMIVTALQLETSGKAPFPEDWVSTMLEEVIDYLLTQLAATDTPVRFAASKALSIVTLKLDSSMATEIVAAVTSSLAENVLWEDPKTREIVMTASLSPEQGKSLIRNLTAVNALRWQGLMLTLAHLLFRRSPPPTQLTDILLSLLSALDFEQRLSTGTTVGTSVRDAACFGIWSLARKYTTTELKNIEILNITNRPKDIDVAVPQQLAVELVIAASCDPSGNIRRGSSAALQELVGRHPDTILEGISLVQIVDYHAVALRSRAMTEVGANAAKLGRVYWEGLLNAMLQWRGVGSPDAASRRTSAFAIGILASIEGFSQLSKVFNRVFNKIRQLKPGDVELRHGLFLSLARIIDAHKELKEANLEGSPPAVQAADELPNVQALWETVDELLMPLRKQITTSSMRPQLAAEACCDLISALSQASSLQFLTPSAPHLQNAVTFVSLCFTRGEDVVVQSSSAAAINLFYIMDGPRRTTTVESWLSELRSGSTPSKSTGGRLLALVAALGAVFGCFEADSSEDYSAEQTEIQGHLLQCAQPEREIELRAAAIQSMTTGILYHKGKPRFSGKALLLISDRHEL